MATSTQAAGAGASDGSNLGDDAWVNAGNVTASDSTAATNTHGLSTSTTEYLFSSAHGFAIPGGSTIDGIEVTARRKCDNSKFSDSVVRLLKAGVLVGSNLSAGATWASSYGNVTFGGSSNLWGTTWTVSDINNSGFGVALEAVKASGSDVAYVDYIEITVYYTALPDAVGTMGNPSGAWIRFMRK